MMDKKNLLKLFVASMFALTAVLFQNCSMVGAPPSTVNSASSTLSAQQVLESKAFTVIKNRCAGCHQPGNAMGGIDYITNLDSLLYYRLVLPAEPQLSELYNVIQNGKMPPTGSLSTAESKAVYDWIASGITTGVAAAPTPSPTLQSTFASINQLILAPKCLGCHNSASAQGGVSFSTYASTMNTVQAGNPNSSSLYTATSTGRMPRGSSMLTASELMAIQNWISSGAKNN